MGQVQGTPVQTLLTLIQGGSLVSGDKSTNYLLLL